MFKDHMSVIINNNNNNNLKNEVLNLNISANCIPVLWGSISIFVNGKFRFSGWLALLKFLYKEYFRPFALNFKIIQFWGVIGLQGVGVLRSFSVCIGIMSFCLYFVLTLCFIFGPTFCDGETQWKLILGRKSAYDKKVLQNWAKVKVTSKRNVFPGNNFVMKRR